VTGDTLLGHFVIVVTGEPYRALRHAEATGVACSLSEAASASRAAAEMEATLAACGDMAEQHGEDAEAWQQGDKSLYTQDMITQRMKLRRDGKVKDALYKWWVTAIHSKPDAMRKGDVSVLRMEGDTQEVTEVQYVTMMKKIYKAMLKVYDANDAENEARADWAKDAKGAPTMGQTRFLDGLFELADVWTKSVEP
jgi:hypothetical protein